MILVERIPQPNVTIQKQLTSLRRNNQTATFNTYSLQKDDEIKVNFKVTNLPIVPAGIVTTITDEYLHTRGWQQT